jgi:hypothetical protein
MRARFVLAARGLPAVGRVTIEPSDVMGRVAIGEVRPAAAADGVARDPRAVDAAADDQQIDRSEMLHAGYARLRLVFAGSSCSP